MRKSKMTHAVVSTSDGYVWGVFQSVEGANAYYHHQQDRHKPGSFDVVELAKPIHMEAVR